MAISEPAEGLPFARAARHEATHADDPGLAGTLALVLGFALVWALYYAIAEAPVGIKHDMAEAYAWGRQFQLGYNQHPPFWAWIAGLWFRLLPRTQWAFGLLSSLNAAIGLCGAWRATGELATGTARRAGFVLLLLTPLYTFYAYKYDANIIFISIWPWTLFAFLRAIETRRAGPALGFGLCVGIAMMSKYYALILIATCFLAALAHPRRRDYFTSAAPWLSGGVAAAILAPHVWWLLAHRAPPIHYLESISGAAWPWVLDHAGTTLGGVIGMNAAPVGLVALAALAARRAGQAKAPAAADPGRAVRLRLLAILTLAPLLLSFAAALVLRTTLTSEMLIGTFPLLPLLAIEAAAPLDTARLARLATVLAGVLTCGALLVAPGFAWWRTWRSPAAMKAEPFQEVARTATRIWRAETHLPLDYVAGTVWYENETAFYSRERPHVFVQFHYAMSLWVTPGRLARHGLLSVCRADDKTCLAATARFVTPRSTATRVVLAHHFWGHTARPVAFVITVIPPWRAKPGQPKPRG